MYVNEKGGERGGGRREERREERGEEGGERRERDGEGRGANIESVHPMGRTSGGGDYNVVGGQESIQRGSSEETHKNATTSQERFS